MPQKPEEFKLIMISAMYENGGNTFHRFLDSQPQLYVYPFESQLGTSLTSDYLTSVFPAKYRWPQLSLNGNIDEDYELIIDEELKRHIKTPFASKFKDAEMDLSDPERKKIFLNLLKGKPRTRKNIVEAFFRSTFLAWKDYIQTGKEIAYVGYCPVICVDAEKIFEDFPGARVIHVVRNPYSAFADTKKRPVPYTLAKYIHIWNLVQLYALNLANMYPENFYIVKFEDLVESPKKLFTNLVGKLGIKYDNTLEYPSWNGRKLETLVPWGTIKTPTTSSNKKTKGELGKKEQTEIEKRTRFINQILGYEHI